MVPPHLHIAIQAVRPSVADELSTGVIRLVTGLAIAALVYRMARTTPWPSPFRLRFAALHVVAAPLAALAWLALSSALEAFVPGSRSDMHGRLRLTEFLGLGIFFYGLVLVVSHAIQGSARAARAEAAASRAQLAALRGQLHPHFLFNALHTVVQLIPADPARAVEAAELLADLLRATLEEKRDEVTLAEEWRFVSRYLAVERIRFGDRLLVREKMPPELLDELIPAFALQTLVENAVRHGAAPRADATKIMVTASGRRSELILSVRNTGEEHPVAASGASAGTGLARLRERLAVLYGSASRLESGPSMDGGFLAKLVVPRRTGRGP